MILNMHHRRCCLAETQHPKRSTENKAHGQKILIHAQQAKCQSFFSPRERGQRCDFQLADTTYGTNSLGWEVAKGCNRCPEVVALANMRMKLFASFLHLPTPLVPKTIDIFFGIIGLDTLSPCSLEPALGSGYTGYTVSTSYPWLAAPLSAVHFRRLFRSSVGAKEIYRLVSAKFL